MNNRRKLVGTLFAAAFAFSTAWSAPASAVDQVIRVGTLKLINAITHYFYDKFAPPGYKI